MFGLVWREGKGKVMEAGMGDSRRIYHPDHAELAEWLRAAVVPDWVCVVDCDCGDLWLEN